MTVQYGLAVAVDREEVFGLFLIDDLIGQKTVDFIHLQRQGVQVGAPIETVSKRVDVESRLGLLLLHGCGLLFRFLGVLCRCVRGLLRSDHPLHLGRAGPSGDSLGFGVLGEPARPLSSCGHPM